MTSPYLAAEARRLKLAAPNRAPEPQLIVSAKAEYRTSDYRFTRRQTDPAPLEKSPRLESRGAKLLRMLMIAFVFAAVWASTAGIVWVLTSE